MIGRVKYSFEYLLKIQSNNLKKILDINLQTIYTNIKELKFIKESWNRNSPFSKKNSLIRFLIKSLIGHLIRGHCKNKPIRIIKSFNEISNNRLYNNFNKEGIFPMVLIKSREINEINKRTNLGNIYLDNIYTDIAITAKVKVTSLTK